MTREEAITQLKMDRDLCNFNPMTGEEEPMNEDCRKSAEALDMAIKALEQEPCNDAVSRKAVLEYIEGSDAELGHDCEKEMVVGDILNMPSVIPTRKKGKWVTKFHGFPPEPSTVCSECDYDIDFEISKLVKADAFTIKPCRPKFCPNCGIEMESEE